MKRIALVLLLVAALAPSAMAGPVGQVQVGYSGSPYGPYQTGQGGEFTLNALSPSGLDTSGYAAGVTGGIGLPGTFQTFCIEGNEYIAGYDTIYNASLDTYAEAGGQTGATAGKDPVSVGTGWLYSQFAQGILAGYNYDGDTDAQIDARRFSAGLLQDALWWLEGEMGLDYDASNIFMAAVVGLFGQIGARADGAATYGVYALNIWTAGGVKAQTQLFYSVPDGGTTLMLLGGALVGLGALRRKFGR